MTHTYFHTGALTEHSGQRHVTEKAVVGWQNHGSHSSIIMSLVAPTTALWAEDLQSVKKQQPAPALRLPGKGLPLPPSGCPCPSARCVPHGPTDLKQGQRAAQPSAPGLQDPAIFLLTSQDRRGTETD